jgi:hypothetical protein
MNDSTIIYNEREDYLDNVQIGDETFDFEENERITIPAKELYQVATKDLRNDVIIDVCEHIHDGLITISTIPYSISKIDDSMVKLDFDDTGTRKYWDGDVGFKLYMETKKAIIEERQKEVSDVVLDFYEDQGDWINLQFSTIIESETLDIVIQRAEQLLQEIEGATDLALGSPFKKREDAKNEADFTIGLVIPLIRKLGFINVKYNHGRREYGKDIVFGRKTEFSDIEFWGAQVKHGDISGGANSEINTIISQAEDSFQMPFYDVYSRSKQRISKLAIIVSGKFKENAVEKICEGIERHSLKNNMVFIDGDKIDTLIEQIRRLS